MKRFEYETTSPRIASRRVTRAITLLNRASRTLESASRSTADRYNRNHLFALASGLRELCLPLYRTASRLEKGGEL
jgi:hypothetical protein